MAQTTPSICAGWAPYAPRARISRARGKQVDGPVMGTIELLYVNASSTMNGRTPEPAGGDTHERVAGGGYVGDVIDRQAPKLGLRRQTPAAPATGRQELVALPLLELVFGCGCAGRSLPHQARLVVEHRLIAEYAGEPR